MPECFFAVCIDPLPHRILCLTKLLSVEGTDVNMDARVIAAPYPLLLIISVVSMSSVNVSLEKPPIFSRSCFLKAANPGDTYVAPILSQAYRQPDEDM